jgi:hypothetical protein
MQYERSINMSEFVKRAQMQLTEVQAKLYINGMERKALEEEAAGLASFINLSRQEAAEAAKKAEQAAATESPTEKKQ